MIHGYLIACWQLHMLFSFVSGVSLKVEGGGDRTTLIEIEMQVGLGHDAWTTDISWFWF